MDELWWFLVHIGSVVEIVYEDRGMSVAYGCGYIFNMAVNG